MNGLTGAQPLAIEPQQIDQLVSIPSIGLLLGRLLRVNQRDLSTVPFAQSLNQPIVETTDFKDGQLVTLYRLMTDRRSELLDDPTARDARLAYSACLDRFLKLAAEFVMTPTSRTRLNVPPKYDEPVPVQELRCEKWGRIRRKLRGGGTNFSEFGKFLLPPLQHELW